MRCNWQRWLWGLIPLIIVSWMAVQIERSRIEQDLAERAKLALSDSGAGWAAVTFIGRDAVLSGRAMEDTEAGKAYETVLQMRGVRVVDNKAELFPKVEPYVWTAGRRNHRIRITGYVPNRVTRQAILGVAKANFPGFDVVDRMSFARGITAADTWLAGVSFALKQLAALKRGDVRLDDLGLSVMGEAEDGPAYRAVKVALAGGLPKGIKLMTDQVTAPVVSPYTWGAQFGTNKLTLTGHVPSEPTRKELLAAAKAAAPAVTVVDRMEPAEGAPQGFAGAATVSVKELLRLESGSAEIKDAALGVAGLAQDEAAAEAARSALKAALPATFKLTEQIKAREAKPLPAPPPVQAPAPAEVVPPAKEPEKSAPKAETAPQQKTETVPARPPETAPAKAAEAVRPQPSPTPAAEPPRPPPVPPSAAEAATPRPQPPPPPAAQAAPARPPGPVAEAAPVQPPARAISPAEAKAQALAKACQDNLSSIQDRGLIHFDTGSAELDRFSFPTLDKLAAAAKTCPDMRIAIEGHTDAEGTQEFNQQLSERRAQSVVRYLVKAGADARQLEAFGHGDRRPKMPNDTIENMAKNRRIEFVVRPQ